MDSDRYCFYLLHRTIYTRRWSTHRLAGYITTRGGYMELEQRIREETCTVGASLYERRYIVGSAGNFSARGRRMAYHAHRRVLGEAGSE